MSFRLKKLLITITLLQVPLTNYGLTSSIILFEESPSVRGKTSIPMSKKPHSNKRPLLSKQTNQPSITDYFNHSKRIKSDETCKIIDLESEDADKENDNSSLLVNQKSVPKSTPEEIKAFNEIFRKPVKTDYEGIKKRILQTKWSLSENGNPVKIIPAFESPDGKPHHITITRWVSEDKKVVKYSALIDRKPLGHWSIDQDSIKRATINIIYKKT